MRESEFIGQLRSLLAVPVVGLGEDEKLEIVRRVSAEIAAVRSDRPIPEASWVPFVTGRRPVDEALYPRLGSSDHVGLILGKVGKSCGRHACGVFPFPFLMNRRDRGVDVTDDRSGRGYRRVSSPSASVG